MIICDACGGVIDPSKLQLHSDWHDSLVVVKPLAADGPVANPNRTKWSETLDC